MYTRLQKEKDKLMEAYRSRDRVLGLYKQKKYKDPSFLLKERVERLQNLHDHILSFSKRYHGSYLFSCYQEQLRQSKRKFTILFKKTHYNASEDHRLLLAYEQVRLAQNKLMDCATIFQNDS